MWINEAFENITGYTLQDVAGKFLGEILKGKPKDADAEKKLLDFRKKAAYEVELSMVGKMAGLYGSW
jgi:PAS domain-containing protein